ncbi:hypothetical protein HCZ94_09715 [Limosilactobacillus fermentum]
MFHPGIILAVALTIYFYFIKKVSIKKVLPALLSLIIYLNIAKLFTGTGTIARIAQMTTGYSTDFMNRNTNGLIVVFLHRLVTILIISSAMIYIYRKTKAKTNSKLDRVLIVFTICLILLSGSMIQNRYLLVVSLIALLDIGMSYFNTKLVLTQFDVLLILIMTLISVGASSIIAYADVKDMMFSQPFIEVFFSNIFSLLKNIPIFFI